MNDEHVEGSIDNVLKPTRHNRFTHVAPAPRAKLKESWTRIARQVRSLSLRLIRHDLPPSHHACYCIKSHST